MGATVVIVNVGRCVGAILVGRLLGRPVWNTVGAKVGCGVYVIDGDGVATHRT